MRRHPHFDLWLHDDGELRPWLSATILRREPLHAWPLSCVERLYLADGSTRIYKVQAAPTVEPEFYARAAGHLLVSAQAIAQPHGPAALLLEDIAAPRLCDMVLTPEEVAASGWSVVAQIHDLAGEVPVVAELCTAAQWEAFAGAMLDDLTLLVADGTFVQVDRGIIGRIAGQVAARPVLAAFAMPTGIVHGDMTASNLFVSDDGYRLIDWQRPIRAPSALDVAALLESTGCDPGRFIAGGIAQLFYLLRLAWFVQCARRWYPAGAATYDGAIVRLVEVITTYNE